MIVISAHKDKLGSGCGVLDDSAVKVAGTVGVEIVLSTPAADRNLWEEYLRGAFASYCRYGAQAALDLSTVREGTSTSLFYALVQEGNVIGGVRAQGPYTCASQSHALVEWAGNAGYAQVRDAITVRIPDGVVEMKSAWVSPNTAHSGKLSAALARVALPTMERLHSRYVMATAADHVLARWESSGGRVDPSVQAAAYPDSRYRTRIMWWDRRTLHLDADPIVWRRMWADNQILWPSPAPGEARPVQLPLRSFLDLSGETLVS
ncbi:hypothetical protein [Rhodococcus sp. IEGM 1318]|uniref:hypothetical protein n=1 Tax=Rhodococcus sp. IEGM 1318 TaxID=3082226 RepID=UPI00295305AF|nr:hypothetical protein [Rhodococcus sp. IEGM 1318]MDV8009544.1 hypothetical protein [Rhodococcus sp. IEGM 1318]